MSPSWFRQTGLYGDAPLTLVSEKNGHFHWPRFRVSFTDRYLSEPNQADNPSRESSVSAPEAGSLCAIGKDFAFQNRLAKLLASNAAGS
jgi:hypothetical protein